MEFFSFAGVVSFLITDSNMRNIVSYTRNISVIKIFELL